jgi:hypothetical protein
MRVNKTPRIGQFVAVSAMIGFLAACSDLKVEDNYPVLVPGTDNQYKPRDQVSNQGIFGEDGIFSFGGSKKTDQGGGGIGVNALLWAASLDTISFMPVTSADPFGGVILTDWFSPSETPNERFKINIFIAGRELRADGVKVAVFRQRLEPGGNWTDSPVEPRTPTNVENAILTRARQIRQSAQR